MKRDDLGFAIQVMANVGVLASLIFLAIETRGNTVAIRAQELGSLFEQDQALLAATIEPDMASLYVKSLFQPAELSLDELQQLTALLTTRMNILRRIYESYRNGVAHEEDWERRVNAVPIYLGTPFGRLWWEHIKPDFAAVPDFVDAVEAALRDSPIVPNDAWMLSLEREVRGLANGAGNFNQ